MKCSKVREKFTEYLEGRLKGEDLSVLEEHLRDCPDCRQELQRFKELDALLKREVPSYWKKIKPVPGFLARLKQLDLGVRRRSRAEVLSGLWQRHRPALVAGISACLVLALALTLSIPQIISPPPESKRGGPEKAVPSKSEAPPGPAELSVKGAPGLREGTAYTEKERERAVEITLNDPEVQESLQGKEYHVKGVYQFKESEKISWDGPVVLIALKGVEPPRNSLYVCVDLEKGKVVKILQQVNERNERLSR